MTTMSITYRDVNKQMIHVINPHMVPRVGDKIDMNVKPWPSVCEVLWQYKNNATSDTLITVVVE